MHKSGSSVQRNDKLPVGTEGLVDLEGPLGNRARTRLVFIRLDNAGKSRAKKGEAFSAVISHGNARGGHDGHETVQKVMRKLARNIFPRGIALHVLDLVGRPIDDSVGKAGRDNHTTQKAQRLVTVHPFAFVFLGSVLGN